MKKTNMSTLKATGIMMIVFALVYVLLGTLAVAGIISNALPGHEKQETMIVILGYVAALLALICGVVCNQGCRRPGQAVWRDLCRSGPCGASVSAVRP